MKRGLDAMPIFLLNDLLRINEIINPLGFTSIYLVYSRKVFAGVFADAFLDMGTLNQGYGELSYLYI